MPPVAGGAPPPAGGAPATPMSIPPAPAAAPPLPAVLSGVIPVSVPSSPQAETSAAEAVRTISGCSARRVFIRSISINNCVWGSGDYHDHAPNAWRNGPKPSPCLQSTRIAEFADGRGFRLQSFFPGWGHVRIAPTGKSDHFRASVDALARPYPARSRVAASRVAARGSRCAAFQFSVSTADGTRLNPEAVKPEAVLVESAGRCNLLPRKIVNGSFSPRPRSWQPGGE